MQDKYQQPDGEQYRRLLERMHDWVWELNDDAVITYSSPRVRHLLGYDPEEIIGRTPFELMSPEAADIARKEFQYYSSLKEPFILHINSFRHKDGHEVIIEESGTPIIDEEGQFRGFTVNGCDVTDRIRAESIQQSKEKYQAIFNNVPAAIYLHDPDTAMILEANKFGSELLGFTIDELRGALRPDLSSAGTPPYTAGEAIRLVKSTAMGQPQRFEWIARHKNGTLFWLEVNLRREMIGDRELVLSVLHNIDSYKRAEEAARESEARFHALVETSAAGIIIFQGTMPVYANPASEHILGFPALDLPRVFWEKVHPDHKETVQAMISLCEQDSPTDEQLLFMFTAKNGNERWILATHGRMVWRSEPAAVVTFFDITDQKVAEEALRISEENYRSVFDGVSETIIVHDSETAQILEVNQAASDTFGYSKDELCKMNVGDFSAGSPPYTQEDAVRWVHRAAAEGPQIFEWLARKKDGQLIWVEVHLKQCLMGGQLRVLCITHDINERKHADEALHREQAYLTSAIEVLPLPIVFSDLRNVVERANEASYKFFRESDPALTEPKNWPRKHFADPVSHTIISDEQTPMQRALRGEATSGEYLIVFPNGREIPILLNCAPVKVGDAMAAIVWALQDITPLKEADRAKNQFLAVLSHELMTPLTSIQGYAQAALSDPAIIPDALQSIVRNSKRQHLILKELLDVSRLLHGKLTIRRQATDLWQLALDSIEKNRLETEEKGVSIQLQPPKGTLPIFADAACLTGTIDNIISNAIKFTDAGGQISIIGNLENGQAILRIQDSGRGMSQEELASLFIPFRQFQRTDKTGGLGLGLTLAKGVVELHGGKLTAASAGLGKGTEFDIALPLLKAKESKAA